MPFINVNIADAKEAQIVPEGAYDLRVVTVEETESKKGKAMLKLVIAIESSDYPNAAPIMEYLNLPHEDDDERQSSFKVLQLARFCHAFEVPFEDNGFDTDDMVGATASEILVKQDTYEEEGKDPLTTNKIVLPRLPNEEAEEGTRSKKPSGGKKPTAKTAGKKPRR